MEQLNRTEGVNIARARIRASIVDPDISRAADMLYEYHTMAATGQRPTKSHQVKVMAHLKRLTKDKKWKP